MTYDSKSNELILNEYQVTETIKEDFIFRWLAAFHIKSGRSVFLQTLKIMVGQNELKELFDYFDQLQLVSKRTMVIPEQVLQDERQNLIMVYTRCPQELMDVYLQRSLEFSEASWEQACEILFALHNRKLTHGLILPNSLVVEENRIQLVGFGYAPLINAGNPTVLKAYRNFIAPEIMAGGKTSSASDVYSLAQTVVHWEPRLIDSEWYMKATQIDMTMRFQRMRDFYPELAIAMGQLRKNRVIEKHDERKQESRGSILVPKNSDDSRKVPPSASGSDGAKNNQTDEVVHKKTQRSLLKGQRLELRSIQVDEEKMIIGVGWDKYSKAEIDTAIFLLNTNGKVNGDEDIIFYGQESSADGQVKLLKGRDRDANQVFINLKNLNKKCQRIVISISVYEAEIRGLSLGDIQSIYCRIINNEGQEILRYEVGEGLKSETALVIAEIYRYRELWKIAAVGSGYIGGLRMLCSNYGVEVT
ncbi:MAG: TerD family protein [Desulfitobacteriaceae bacterium]|nr:TerD family protein [Desulfitobacteriaceae bacterium]